VTQDKPTAEPGGGPFCELRDGVLCSPYGPHDLLTITLPMEDWGTVQHYLQYGKDYHTAKKWEWLTNCKDKRMATETAAGHERAAAEAERLCKIIEDVLYPAPPKETETE
jgi:hypothetical protein